MDDKHLALKNYTQHCREAFNHVELDGFARNYIAVVKRECTDEISLLMFAFGGYAEINAQVMHQWLAHFDERLYHDLLGAVRAAGTTEAEISKYLMRVVSNHPRSQDFLNALQKQLPQPPTD
ncbi:MAG: hypothetical protein WA001_04140 [Patescibacteria group bacterium]